MFNSSIASINDLQKFKLYRYAVSRVDVARRIIDTFEYGSEISYCKILCLNKHNFTSEIIRRNYKTLSRVVHPNGISFPISITDMKMLSDAFCCVYKAYEVLQANSGTIICSFLF